jgi:hypothetical protein
MRRRAMNFDNQNAGEEGSLEPTVEEVMADMDLIDWRGVGNELPLPDWIDPQTGFLVTGYTGFREPKLKHKQYANQCSALCGFCGLCS